jgi:hypothetical protein
MKVQVTIKCKGCGWAWVVEPEREMEVGSQTMGAVYLDGHKVMCMSCNSTVYEVVNVHASS